MTLFGAEVVRARSHLCCVRLKSCSLQYHPTTTTQHSPFTGITGTSSPSVTPSSSTTGTATGTQTPSTSSTTTSTTTSTPTQTATSSNVVSLFAQTSIIAIRLGDAANNASAAAAGKPLPVYVDEYASYGALGEVITTTSLPFASCSLAVGKTTASPYVWFDTEGLPSLTADGQRLIVPCYASATAGATLGTSSSVIRTLLTVDAAGLLDMSTTTNVPYGPGTSSSYVALHIAAAKTLTSGFYLAGAPGRICGGSCNGGFVYVPYGVFTSFANAIKISAPPATDSGMGYADARAVHINGSSLYASEGNDASWAGVARLGSASALPTAPVATASLVGVGGSPWTFVFAATSSLWVADSSSPTQYNVIQYMYDSIQSMWSINDEVLIARGTSIYSLIGRYSSVDGNFYLYMSTPRAILQYAPETRTITTIATAASGTLFRGVAFAPVNTAWYVPSGTGTETTTQSSTSTGSVSSTKSGTITHTGTRTTTPSSSSTRSNTPSSSGTRTGTAASTVTNTASISSSASPSARCVTLRYIRDD